MPSASERDPRLYLEDMIAFCDRVLLYTKETTQQALMADHMRYDATLRNLELMGEAATRIPSDLREKAPQIAWRQVVATRNRLIHAYLGIDDDIIWSIVHDDIPELRDGLIALLNSI